MIEGEFRSIVFDEFHSFLRAGGSDDDHSVVGGQLDGRQSNCARSPVNQDYISGFGAA